MKPLIPRSGVFCFEFNPPLPTDLPVDEFIALALDRGHLISCNPDLAAMYGYRNPGDMVGLSLKIFLGADGHTSNATTAFWPAGEFRYVGEMEITGRDGAQKRTLNILDGAVENGVLTRVWGSQTEMESRAPMPREKLEPPAPQDQQSATFEILRERVRVLEDHVTHLRKVVVEGNGQPSLVTRITVVQEKLIEQQSSFRFWVPSVIAGVSMIIAAAAVGVAIWI